MSHRMNRDEYAKCIEDDIAFLEEHLPGELRHCLWTTHIEDVLRHSVTLLYGPAGQDGDDDGMGNTVGTMMSSSHDPS